MKHILLKLEEHIVLYSEPITKIETFQQQKEDIAVSDFKSKLSHNSSCVKINCLSRKHQGTFVTGKIRPDIKFVAFRCVFLTKIKVDPKSW